MIPSWLGRVVAATVVRRLVLLLLAAALAWCGIGRAEASCVDVDNTGNGACDTRAEAYSFAQAQLPRVDNYCQGDMPQGRRVTYYAPASYAVEYKCVGGVYNPSGFGASWPVGQDCPAGTTWNGATFTCDAPNNCASAIPITGGRASRNSIPICSGGCTYAPVIETGPEPSLTVQFAGGYTASSLWKPTGATCGTPNEGESWDRNKSTCVSTGGSFLECVRPDGTHCVTGASGRSFCWKNGEEGPKRTADGTEGADRKKSPTPNTPPPGINDPTQTGTNQGGTVINGNQYNTSTYSGSGGAGQGDTGTPGDGDGDGKPDGGGSGNGDGEGDDGPGAVGGGVGDLYEGSGKTVASVFETFKGQVQASPLIGAAGSFLTVSVSGTCPTFTLPETAFWSAMEFNYHCQGVLADALALGAYLLLAVAAYTAFKIGFG